MKHSSALVKLSFMHSAETTSADILVPCSPAGASSFTNFQSCPKFSSKSTTTASWNGCSTARSTAYRIASGSWPTSSWASTNAMQEKISHTRSTTFVQVRRPWLVRVRSNDQHETFISDAAGSCAQFSCWAKVTLLVVLPWSQGRNEGEQGGHNSPGAESKRGAPKSPNNVAGTFFNIVHMLPKDLRFEHGGAKRISCPGRHLTSLRPCMRHFDCSSSFKWIFVLVKLLWASVAINRKPKILIVAKSCRRGWKFSKFTKNSSEIEESFNSYNWNSWKGENPPFTDCLRPPG